ncbi:MAG: GSCFA domain-containing protein [Polaribacter sp.]|nr:GSCFA domain-containing protein [Polaribacter sp.]
MILQTKIPLDKETKKPISYLSKIFLLGSCFSENIGDQLNYFKFQMHQNPFGIFFHPKAIENFISNVIHEKKYVAEDLIFQDEQWHSFDAHSKISSSDQEKLLEDLNLRITTTKKRFQEVSHIIITLGTSWVYTYIETNTVVANCHKIPQKKFSKKLLSIDEISKSLETIILLLSSINKNIKIIFTISPVRHKKEGMVQNTRSKAHLISAIHNILNRKNVSYFPSYEIMMDELRDYRFYAEDMIHPNKTAIQYIWEQFVATWLTGNSTLVMKEVASIQKGLTHKPFNKDSEMYQKFLHNLNKKKETIKNTFSFIEF